MAARAELRARLTLDKSLFDRGIAGAQVGAAGLAKGLTSIGSVAARGFLLAGAAAIGLGTGIAIGTKHAFHLGATLDNLSKRTGIGAGKLAVLQLAFKDAGLEADKIGPSINRMQRYLQTAGDKGIRKLGLNIGDLKKMKPEDQFMAIGKAIAAIKDPAEKTAAVMDIFKKAGGELLPLFANPKAFEDAAASLGGQAAILDQKSGQFKEISDKLEHAGTKLQGFFVGVAGGVSDTLQPLLNKLDGLDFSAVGQKFGAALVTGAQAIVGFFNNPSLLFDAASNYFKASMLGVGNVLISAFQSALQFFQSGMVSTIDGLAAVIGGTLMEAFAKPIAYFQAGIEHAMALASGKGNATPALDFQIAAKTKLRDTIGVNMSGHLNSIGKGYQADIDKLTATRAEIKKNAVPLQPIGERAKEIMAAGGSKFEGRTAAQIKEQGKTQFNEGISKAIEIAKGTKVTDVLGAGAAFTAGNAAFGAAAQQGAPYLPAMSPSVQAATAPGKRNRFAGFSDNLGVLKEKMGSVESSAYGAIAAGDIGKTSSPDAYQTHPDAYGQVQSGQSDGGGKTTSDLYDLIDQKWQ